MATWREREAQAQLERVLPIWVNEPFWKEQALVHADHFVHLSQKNPPLLAYTASEEKGERDIQTPIKAGRYLTQYFSKVLTAKQIAFLASWQAQGVKPKGDESEAELKFATTPDEICDVYARGPQSCMDGEAFRRSEMPVRVYGAGDLAIAYFEGKGPPRKPEHTVLARCLVWPEKKVAGRVYPTPGNYARDGYLMFETDNSYRNAQAAHEAMHRAMVTKLKAEGYRFLAEGYSFNGAKLLKISERGDHVMPYLDNDYGVCDAGPHWVMSDDPNYPAQDTNGYLEDAEDHWTCNRCEHRQRDHDDSYEVGVQWIANNGPRGGGYWQTETWCDDCNADHAFYCEGYDENVSDDQSHVEVNGNAYSFVYAERHFYQSDYSGDWFDPDNDPRVEMDNGETWAVSEFDDYGEIDESGACVPKGPVPTKTIHDEAQEEIPV